MRNTLLYTRINFFLYIMYVALEPIPNAFTRNIRKYPHMHDEKYAAARFGAAASQGPLVLPHVDGEVRRVIYTITEYHPLLDSSNMSINEWTRIAEDIQVSYFIPT